METRRITRSEGTRGNLGRETIAEIGNGHHAVVTALPVTNRNLSRLLFACSDNQHIWNLGHLSKANFRPDLVTVGVEFHSGTDGFEAVDDLLGEVVKLFT